MKTAGTISITYAWGCECIGDMAIAPGLLRLLREALPAVEPVMFTYARDAEAHKATARYLRRWEPGLRVFADPFGPLIGSGSPEERAWRFHAHLLRPGATIEECRRRMPAAIEAWLEADLRLFNASMQLTHRQNGESYRHWLPNALAGQLGLPYALWSQSFGEIEFPGREMLELFLARAELVTTRDASSRDLLATLPLIGPLTGYTADPILFFEHRDPAWAEAFLQEQALRPGEFLVVLPRTFEFWGAEPPEAGLAARLDKIARAIDLWIARTGQPVLIGYELPRERARYETLLRPRLSAASAAHCRFFQGTWLAEQALAVFAQASAVLSMERYSVYLALAAGTPVLHPTSNALSLRMDVLDRIGLAESHLLIDTCGQDEVAERLLALHTHSAAHVRRAAAGRARLKQESVDTLRQLWTRARDRAAAVPRVAATSGVIDGEHGP